MHRLASIQMTSIRRVLAASLVLIVALFALAANCNQLTAAGGPSRRQQSSSFAARRAADDSRPLLRPPGWSRASSLDADESQDSTVVVGKFKAPAPERFQRQQVPKSSQFASQTMSASYRVADSSAPEKVVHGITGGSSASNNNKQRVVSAKFQVSDEGLNYPPSKLSADIYGNVAEIVTAPPEAVDSDFLLPTSHRFMPPANGQGRP
jgi:hypothetical protein